MEEKVGLTQAPNGEDYVLCQGKSLYSRYAPSASSERAASLAEMKENCIYIVPSPLLGYGIFSFIKRMPESSVLIGIECDQDLMALTAPQQQRIMKEIPGYRCYRIGSPGQLYELFRRTQTGQYRHCSLLALNGGYGANKSRYDALFSTLQLFMKNYWQNRLTMAKMGHLWIKNLAENLSFLAQRDIKEFHTQKPVLLAGAGESLEKTIPLIQRYRDSIYLLCVDTALQPLLRSDILPDGIVNLEAQFYNLKDFYGLQNHKFDLFSDITAFPSTLRLPNCTHYIFTSSFEETTLHSRLRSSRLLPSEIPPLGSVGVTALYLAGEISHSRIFITGLDFSYIQGKTHARETPFHDWCRLQEGRLKGDVWYTFSKSRPSYPAVGKIEKLVTNRILESYGKQLEDLCKTMDHRVFDLGKMGLKMSIPTLETKEFEHMIQSIKIGTGIKNYPESPNEKKNTVLEFKKSEIERLKNLLFLWEGVVSGKYEEQELLPYITDCDYLYFHFPDRKELPNTDPAFLFRVIREARIILKHLSK
ncbi:DUF115 domain-containing protein [Oceanispirochaeta crateris]|uniref:DUF115 domain-containing protein n=1 Tax=Oceanispirochaeta crateris TaxID=2518645 RepID=A0A5C1QK99_9SPIO|nr:6-hydroxymethylpterin diphosphokinase MptE-like protein [Oceanispirochaeta crateris]QEN07748.1 DUF115 domain-containing protein [Oceanispirochaeta crateris]